jgi:transposase
MKKASIGIDISKSNFHVCFKIRLEEGKIKILGTSSFQNNTKGFEELLDWVDKKNKEDPDPVFVMEATGVYGEDLVYFLHDQDRIASVVLPNRMKGYFKSLNIKTKTDKIDSKIIAEYGIERRLDIWKPMSSNYKALRELCRELLALKNTRTKALNQLHAMKYAHGRLGELVKMKESQIEFYDDNIAELKKHIQLAVESDQQLVEKLKKVVSIPGLGFETAVILASETNGFLLFHNIKQVVSYAGLDVSHNESGRFRGRSKISKKGNTKIRQALFMPALTATVHNQPIKGLYERICEKNPNIKRKGVVASMRKLLILAYTLWKKDEIFNKEYKWAA